MVDQKDHLKKRGSAVLCAVPFCLCCLMAFFPAWWLFLCAILSLFAVTALYPKARRRESIFMFALAAVSLTPVNIRLLVLLCRSFLLAVYDSMLHKILWLLLAYSLLFSIEEIVLGIPVRVIWPRQLKSALYDREEDV